MISKVSFLLSKCVSVKKGQIPGTSTVVLWVDWMSLQVEWGIDSGWVYTYYIWVFMLIGSITRTTVACLCSCGKLRARNYERLHPPPSPPTFLSTYRPPDEIEFQPFLTFWPLAPPASGGGLIYIYWSIKSANHELLGQPHYLNKKTLSLLLHRAKYFLDTLASLAPICNSV